MYLPAVNWEHSLSLLSTAARPKASHTISFCTLLQIHLVLKVVALDLLVFS